MENLLPRHLQIIYDIVRLLPPLLLYCIAHPFIFVEPVSTLPLTKREVYRC